MPSLPDRVMLAAKLGATSRPFWFDRPGGVYSPVEAQTCFLLSELGADVKLCNHNYYDLSVIQFLRLATLPC